MLAVALARLDRVAALAVPLARPRTFVLLVALYYLTAWAIRTLLLSGASGDEAQLMLYGQGFALSYDFGNPPLAGWLSVLEEGMVGPSLGAAVAIRYALLAAFFAFMLAAAREAIEDRRLATLAALSPVAFWFLGWVSLTVYMDSLVLIAALAATIWLLLRLARCHAEGQPATAGYIGLALALAAGLLGKFTFGPTAGLLILAALPVARFRAVVADRRFWFAVLAAAVLAAPAYAHVILHLDVWLAEARSRVVEQAIADTPPAGPAERVLVALKAALDFSLPLLPLFLLVFARSLWNRRRFEIDPDQRAAARWLGLWLALMLVAIAVATVVLGLEKLRQHYLFVLVPLPLVLFALLDGEQVGPTAVGGYLAALFGLALSALGALAAQAVVQPLECGKCRLVMPWSDYAEELARAGFTRGTILSFDSPSTDAGANLRRHLPDTRVWSDKRPRVTPPPLALSGACVVIWNDTRYPQTIDYLRSATLPEIGGPLPADAVIGTLEATLPLSGKPAPVLGYAFIARGVGDCR